MCIAACSIRQTGMSQFLRQRKSPTMVITNEVPKAQATDIHGSLWLNASRIAAQISRPMATKGMVNRKNQRSGMEKV
jgi:hypothetical protein